MGVYDIFSCACGAGGGRIPLTCLRHNEELRLGLDAATQQGAWGSDRGQRYMGAILDREACQVLRVLCTFLGDRCAERSFVSAPVLAAQFWIEPTGAQRRARDFGGARPICDVFFVDSRSEDLFA